MRSAGICANKWLNCKHWQNTDSVQNVSVRTYEIFTPIFLGQEQYLRINRIWCLGETPITTRLLTLLTDKTNTLFHWNGMCRCFTLFTFILLDNLFQRHLSIYRHSERDLDPTLPLQDLQSTTSVTSQSTRTSQSIACM